MKKILSFCASACLLLACLCVSAQQNEYKEFENQETLTEKPSFKGINLSPEQKEQLAEIRKDIVLDRSVLQQMSAKNKETAVKMVEEYQQKILVAFKKILTDEQLEQYENNMKGLNFNKTKELNLGNKK